MAAAAAEGSPFHIIATYNCRRRDREGARGWTRAVGSALGGGKRRMGEKLVRAFKNPSSWLGFWIWIRERVAEIEIERELVNNPLLFALEWKVSEVDIFSDRRSGTGNCL